MESKYNKPYVRVIVSYLKNHILENDTVVEVGCGLCDILGNKTLKMSNRVGIDCSEGCVLACKELYPDIKMVKGTLLDVKKMKINYLIMVNFLHNIAPSEIQDNFNHLLKYNDISCIIVDEVNGVDYKYTHDFSRYLLGFTKTKLFEYKVPGGVRSIYIYNSEE